MDFTRKLVLEADETKESLSFLCQLVEPTFELSSDVCYHRSPQGVTAFAGCVAEWTEMSFLPLTTSSLILLLIGLYLPGGTVRLH
jgi:hypothetical protein